MNFSWFIAKKVISQRSKKSFTRLIFRISTISVAVSVAVMLISFSVIKGFKEEIQTKVAGFEGHIIISKLDNNHTKEPGLFPKNQSIFSKIKQQEGIKAMYPVAQKAGILKTETEIEGLLFKGVNHHFYNDFFEKYITNGRFLTLDSQSISQEIILSSYTAERLNLDTGQRVEVVFIEKGNVRLRKLKICGIYNTGFVENDKIYALTDIKNIQRIQTLGFDSINRYEIILNDIKNIDSKTDKIDAQLGYELQASSLKDLNPVIFQWLEIVDANVAIIVVLMLLIAIINMITSFLILVIERTNMIGILKALGAGSRSIRNIFLLNGVWYIFLGIVIGNLLAILVIFLQTEYQLIGLDQEIYYMDKAPMRWDLISFVQVNLLSLIICSIVLIVPGMLVYRISPVKSIQFK